MDTFIGRYRNVSILAAAVFLQLIGLAYQVKKQTSKDSEESSRLLRVWAISAITPLEKGIVRLQTGTGNLWHNYVYLRGVRQENRDLQEKLQKLQLEQVRLQQDATQARRLQSLLGFKEQFIDQTIAAQVIGSSGSEQSRVVYIDKGSTDGIKEGMPVISAEGIVGKVILVQSSVSQVLLINDQTSGVGTILEQSRLQGVLKGRASGQLVLDKVMSEEDVKTGERVLTSGGDQIFPKGLPVGTIGEVKRGGEFLQVQVKPAAALNHLEEVLVITKKREREPDKAAVSSMRAADILAQRLPQVPDKPAEPAKTGSQTIGSTNLTKPATAGGMAPGVAQPKPTIGASVPSPGTQPKPIAPVPTGTTQTTTHPATLGSVPLTTKPVQSRPLQNGASGNAQATSQPKATPAGTAPAATTVKKPAAQPAQTTPPIQTAPQSDTGDTPQ
ncbi:MAG TPA: rod shape-determining protein MreC [Terriglobales bacterium]|nr:rod shape-determining protein MreC [Terriglobales bacterium]